MKHYNDTTLFSPSQVGVMAPLKDINSLQNSSLTIAIGSFQYSSSYFNPTLICCKYLKYTFQAAGFVSTRLPFRKNDRKMISTFWLKRDLFYHWCNLYHLLESLELQEDKFTSTNSNSSKWNSYDSNIDLIFNSKRRNSDLWLDTIQFPSITQFQIWISNILAHQQIWSFITLEEK